MAKSSATALITSAARGRSLDLEERQRRYLWTMAIRTACFLLFLVLPGWWKVAALAGAALLPAFAVVFANGADHRPPPGLTPGAGIQTRLGIASHEVVPGSVEVDS